MTYSSIVYSVPTRKRQQKLWILNYLYSSQMLKQCLVFQRYTNNITKNYFINSLHFHEHILKFRDFFST